MKSRFCLKTYVVNFQRCRPAFAEAASRRQVQGFGKMPAALCGDFPAKPPSTPTRFRYCFFTTDGFIERIPRVQPTSVVEFAWFLFSWIPGFLIQSSNLPAGPLSLARRVARSMILLSVHCAGSSIRLTFGPRS